jgi:hypothetical protein
MIVLLSGFFIIIIPSATIQVWASQMTLLNSPFAWVNHTFKVQRAYVNSYYRLWIPNLCRMKFSPSYFIIINYSWEVTLRPLFISQNGLLYDRFFIDLTPTISVLFGSIGIKPEPMTAVESRSHRGALSFASRWNLRTICYFIYENKVLNSFFFACLESVRLAFEWQGYHLFSILSKYRIHKVASFFDSIFRC